MSFSRSGQERTVNSVGKCHFGKWFLYRTTEKEDMWRKPVVNDEQGIIVSDSYIQIRRINVSPEDREYGYRIWFSGDARFLREHFGSFYKGYQDHDSECFFDDIQAAKDYIDRFIDRLNKLLVFI